MTAKQKNSKSIAKLLMILALVILPCTVLAPINAMADEQNVSFSSVVVRETKLYESEDMKTALLTLPKGANVTVTNYLVDGNPNVYQVTYKKKSGFVDIKYLLDSETPVISAGSMGSYDSRAKSAPLYYVKAKKEAVVRSSPSTNGSVVGAIDQNTVLGVYRKTNGFYEVSYNGERYYSATGAFTKTTPDGTVLYVISESGGRIRPTPVIPARNARENVFDVINYKESVTVLSRKSVDGWIWYKVLAKVKNLYYVEGYMRSDVLNRNSNVQAERYGTNRVINNGTKKKSNIRSTPDGTIITSLSNGSIVFATGEIEKGKDRNWAKITSPVVGWIAASHIGFAR